jgi:hypothetical protein
MPDDTEIPKVLRLIVREARRERSPEEENAARRFVLGQATVAEYLAARQQDATR